MFKRERGICIHLDNMLPCKSHVMGMRFYLSFLGADFSTTMRLK
jgi:hypothetical protein